MYMKRTVLSVCCLLACWALHAGEIGLSNGRIDVRWTRSSEGWKITRLKHAGDGPARSWGVPDGRYTLLYSAVKPDAETPQTVLDRNGDTIRFVEPVFRNVLRNLQRSVTEVPLNRAGEAYVFYPETARREGDRIRFTGRCPVGRIEAEWWLDERFPDDIRVRTTFTPDRPGYYSLSSATPAVLEPAQIRWGVVPGWFQGCAIQPQFRLAYLYGQGLPDLPVVCRESTLTTLTSVLSAKNGLTLSVIVEDGQDRDPYEKDANTHYSVWKIGLSHMNRAGELCPTAYHPVLGEAGSLRESGAAFGFDYRYTLSRSDWFEPYRHAIYDVYGLREGLALKHSVFSLTDRLHALHDYVVDDTLSLWRVEEYKGMKIGAQAYLGSVVGSEGDAMKNSDVGSAWMLAAATDDPRLREERLPYIRNFKLLQQDDGDEFLSGSAQGQYYLSRQRRFVEEWGSHTEPVALTYYVMADLGNMLLFRPQDSLLRVLLRRGADRLLAWQHPDGSFDVAYDKRTRQPIYTDLDDLRPTFYGFVVAYRLLGDRKYLDAAIRGADWFVRHAVDKGSFLGVCGDTRFTNDFATGQSAQALLDLWEITGAEKYREAAVRTARIYTASIYTHKRPSEVRKYPKGKEWKDWQISQVGLSFEHGGAMGSAVHAGPILLSSHCGLFVRMYDLTRDSLFLDLARAGAIAREAHLNPQNKVSTYYWSQFDRGPASFPMHAWWQIGWIGDYLLSEAEMRSGGAIRFPRGFFTPKVGPQQITGFDWATLYGQSVRWVLRRGLARVDNADVDCLTTLSRDGRSLCAILLNSSAHEQRVSVAFDPARIGWKGFAPGAVELSGKGGVTRSGDTVAVSLEPFGLRVVRLARMENEQTNRR